MHLPFIVALLQIFWRLECIICKSQSPIYDPSWGHPETSACKSYSATSKPQFTSPSRPEAKKNQKQIDNVGIFNPKRLPKVSTEAISLLWEECEAVPQNVVCLLAAVAAAAAAAKSPGSAAFGSLGHQLCSTWADITEVMVSIHKHRLFTFILWSICVYKWSKNPSNKDF